MGTIIRNNVFETNSSSTHSITIIDCKDKVDKGILLDNNILYPENLSATYYDEYHYVLETCTTEQKLALIAHWIKYLDEENNNDLMIKFEKLFNIKVNSFIPKFYSDAESGNFYLDYNNFDNSLEYLKNNVIYNNDVKIIDQYVEN